MNKHKNAFFIIAFCIVFFISSEKVFAGDIRNPVWAGSFYPAKRSDLGQTIENLIKKAKKPEVQISLDKRPKALILPHAGYIYSGLTLAHASFVLSGKRFSKVILMGPDHRAGFTNCAVSNADAWKTPMGLVKLHPDALKLCREYDMFRPVPASDRTEHCIEVILPFLQYLIKDFELVPIVMGTPCNIDKFIDAVLPLLDENTLLVVSSDLSHYLPYNKAVKRDKKTIDMIINLEDEKLNSRENCACGKIPVMALIKIARRKNWHPVLLHYSNSGNTAGSHANVVGYSVIAFLGDESMDNNNMTDRFTEEQGQVLVRLARQTIMEKLGIDTEDKEFEDLDKALQNSKFETCRGTFVTLNIDGQLRGCIGSLAATEPVKEGVRRNAINAAFHDPRFPSLTKEEMKNVDIEVSILTDPKPLEYKDGADLIRKLRKNIDGVILQKGFHSATFLPQVWEQLPQPEEFLSHLCMKAGLPANAWKTKRLEVLIYQVQYFEE